VSTTDDDNFLELKTAGQVTDEIANLAFEIADGWYQDTRIDWEDLLNRLDGSQLADKSVLDLGNDLMSPAIKEIKRRVQVMRKEAS